MKKLLAGAATVLSVAAVTVPTVALAGGTASASSAGAQFAADRATLNAASNTFAQAFEAWEKSGGPVSQTSSFVGTYVSAMVAEDHKLLSQGWPAKATSDINTLVRGDAAVEGVVSSLPSISSSTAGDWFIVYNQDAAVAVADANVVRHDLGLPLASTA
jgi:hypothetical protein